MSCNDSSRLRTGPAFVIAAIVVVLVTRAVADDPPESPAVPQGQIALSATGLIAAVQKSSREEASVHREVERQLRGEQLSTDQAAAVLWLLARRDDREIAAWCMEHITMRAVPASSNNPLLGAPAWWWLHRQGASVLDALVPWVAGAERPAADVEAVAGLLDSVFGCRRALPITQAALAEVTDAPALKNVVALIAHLERSTVR